jgi:hypothetical protein
MDIPLAFPEKKFEATTSVKQIMEALFRGGGKGVLVDILIVGTL